VTRSTPLTFGLFSTVLAVFAPGMAHGAGILDGNRDADNRGFAVVETSIGWRLVQREGPWISPWAWSWNLGYLDRTEERAAWGAAVKLTTDESGFRVGPVVRHRRWLGNDVAVDVGAGLYVRSAFETTLMPTTDLALSYKGLVGVHAGFDLVHSWDRAPHGEGHVGLRLGKGLAPAVMVPLLAIAVGGQ
jgi:hypothetical protein